MLRTRTKSFLSDETGAVTVDWVVLTAAIVALAGGAALVAMPGISQLAINIGMTTSDLQVGFDAVSERNSDAPEDAPASNSLKVSRR